MAFRAVLRAAVPQFDGSRALGCHVDHQVMLSVDNSHSFFTLGTVRRRREYRPERNPT